MWKPTINLFVAAAGAGVLSFPYVFKEAGAVIGPLLFAGMAINAAWINAVFVHFAGVALRTICSHPEGSRRYRSAAHLLSFETMIYVLLGPAAHTSAVASVLVACGGALTAYLILVKDMWGTAMSSICGSPDWRGDACTWATSPAFPIVLFGLVVALPLSCFTRLGSLGWVSVTSALALAIAAGCIVASAATAIPSSAPSPSSLTLWGSPWAVLTVLPIAAFSLGNQFQVLPSWVEHREGGGGGDSGQEGDGGSGVLGRLWHGARSSSASSSSGRVVVGGVLMTTGQARQQARQGKTNTSPPGPFWHALALSTLLAFLTYTTVGLVCYAAYGQATQGDILLSLEGGTQARTALATTARLAMVVHLALAYPVQLYPARVCCELLLASARQRLMGRGKDSTSTSGVGTGQGSIGTPASVGSQAGAPGPSARRTGPMLISTVLVATTCALASIGPGVQQVFSVVGGLVAIVLFALPGCLLWGEARRVEAAAAKTDGLASTRGGRQAAAAGAVQQQGWDGEVALGLGSGAVGEDKAWADHSRPVSGAAVAVAVGALPGGRTASGAGVTGTHSHAAGQALEEPLLDRQDEDGGADDTVEDSAGRAAQAGRPGAGHDGLVSDAPRPGWTPPPPEPRYVPSSPMGLRIAALWMFLCAGGIGGLGAGLSIYSLTPQGQA